MAITLTNKGVTSEFNEEFIKHSLNEYQFRLPVYYDQVTSLIGIFAKNNENLVFEYHIDKDIIKANIESYNIENKRDKTKQIKDIEEYLKKEVTINDFIEKKKKSHINKCNTKFQGQNIFEENLNIIFRYYMNEDFYGEFFLNKNECKKYN